MEFIPFRFTTEYPAYDSTRMDVVPYETQFDGPLHPGIHSFEGTWKAAFRNYLTESIILWTTFYQDSARFGFLARNANFQSNNALIMLHYLAGAEMLDKFGPIGRHHRGRIGRDHGRHHRIPGPGSGAVGARSGWAGIRQAPRASPAVRTD